MDTTQNFDIPPAPVAPPAPETVQEQVTAPVTSPTPYEVQLPLVHERVMGLSWDRPSVTFELSSPLDTQLMQLLLARGYNVENHSITTMRYGHVNAVHRVTISIPNAIGGMRSVGLRECPVFRFPYPFRYFHGLF